MRTHAFSLLVALGGVLVALPCCGGSGGDPADDGGGEPLECGDCHGVPPATGAHLAHYGETLATPRVLYGDLRITESFEPDGSPLYLFGCGNCHPTDPALHDDGTLQVELYSASAPAESLKALNPPSAVYDDNSCSNVYCHSSGQASPTYVETPPWTALAPGIACDACHGNPPRYPSGGAGSETANSHLMLADDGYEFGHFAGLPGPWHTDDHGRFDTTGEYAAPITCQTCHFESVDAANTGPGGFYYLDTTGDYDLGGLLWYSCTACHDGEPGSPASSAGRAAPLRHVNGRRDVDFDPRTSIPDGVSGLPAAPDRPTRPYWVGRIPGFLPADSGVDGATWSLHLANAAYDPMTKTCSNVGCHLKQSSGSGSPVYEPLTWGTTPVGNATCLACHQF